MIFNTLYDSKLENSHELFNMGYNIWEDVEV